MNYQLKIPIYCRVGSLKQLNLGSINLKDNLGIPPKVYEKKLYNQKYIQGLRAAINYRKLGKKR